MEPHGRTRESPIASKKGGIMKSFYCLFGICLSVILCASVANADVFSMPTGLTSLEFVPVGDPGNVGELSGTGAGGRGPDRICGAVDYTYNIGKFEVTAGQYTEFLNAVAKTDTYGLYNTEMFTSNHVAGCNIQRTGSAGSYTYTIASDWANRPVNFVSWGDSARFANWLNNGQPTGAQDLNTTEDGAYYLNGATSNAALLAATRKVGAKWVITSEDEWFKAAYYKVGGTNVGYWDYPTGTNNTLSNDLVNPDPGNNACLYQNGNNTIGSPYYRTEVGEFENSESPYGTFDQGGNVWEWNEAIMYSSWRGVRGGGWSANSVNDLHTSIRDSTPPTAEISEIGFRVAEVPEPATLTVLALGGVALLRRKSGYGG